MTTPLSTRQKQVVRLLSDGYGVREVAHKLGLSEKTVEYHSLNARKIISPKKPCVPIMVRYALCTGLVKGVGA